MKNKFLTAVILLLVALVMPSVVNAQAGYSFTDIDVNGVDMDNSPVIYVERDENVYVQLNILAFEDTEDVRVKAWIGGYEYGDVKVMTDIFDIEEGVTYPVALTFQVPADMDASKDYTLHVEAYDKDNQHEQEYTLRIKEKRHLIKIQDVMFNPGLSVKNTEPLFVVVRLENMGDNKEEDIKVQVSIPSLGIAQSTYVDELTKVDDDEDESSDSSDTLYLDLSNVKQGIYNLRVTAEYNRGHDIVGRDYTIVVEEDNAEPTQSPILLGITQRSKSVAKGNSVTYDVSIANLGESHLAFTAELSGVDKWASSNINPEIVVVPSGASSELKITLTPSTSATEGKHQFLLTLKDSQGNEVKQVALETVISGKSRSAWAGVKTGLEIAFIVLLIIAIILAIVIGIQKASNKDGEFEAPNNAPDNNLAPEPATYY